jgi:penicillin-binding protein 1A
MQLTRFGWRLLLLVPCACICGLFLVLSASYLYLGPKLPSATQITQVQFQTPLRIYSADHDLIAEFGNKRRIPLTYKQFPPALVHAILAAEDADFFEHGAVDIKGLARAAYELARYREIRSGGSTITMQVARNFFLTLNQTFLRKFNEIVLAIQIEHLLSKQQILALYLNKIFLGHHAYGMAAAAQVYFGKPLNELTLAQIAMIAGLPKAPSAYNPISNPERALVRRNWILGRMKALGNITEAEYQLAAAQPVTASYHDATPDIEAGYVAELARQQVLGLLGNEAYTSGLSVYTTITSTRQRAAVAALRQGLQDYDMRHGWRGPEGHIDVQGLPALPETTAGTDISAGTRAATTALSVSSASQEWAQKLASYNEVANLQVALVADVSDASAVVVLKDARVIQLGWDAMSWASPYVDVDTRGPAPEKATQIIKPGDVVRLLPIQDASGKSSWRLAEIPSIQGALVSMDPQTGAIQAMQGGYSFDLSHFNRATQALRQPGSSFKPFIYTSALEHGLTTATLLNDAPLVFSDKKLETIWRPTGDTKQFYGPTRLRVALYRSLNLASIRLLQQVGLDNAFATLKQFHLPTSRFPKNLSIVLGSVSVSPMQMATAYSTFANSGFHIQPWLIDSIKDSKGQVLWRAPSVLLCDPQPAKEAPSSDIGNPTEQATNPAQAQTSDGETDNSQCPSTGDHKVSEDIDSGGNLAPLDAEANPNQVKPVYRYRVLDKRVAWLMYSIMQDVINKGTGRRASSLHYPGLAGKTGTTNDQVDAWFSGYTPDLTTSVWTGFDQPAPLGRDEQGAVTALPVWIDYMKQALPPKPVRTFPEPAGISAVLINSDTGLRAHPGDPDTLFEYFRSENIPPFGRKDSNDKTVTPQGLF